MISVSMVLIPVYPLYFDLLLYVYRSRIYELYHSSYYIQGGINTQVLIMTYNTAKHGCFFFFLLFLCEKKTKQKKQKFLYYYII